MPLEITRHADTLCLVLLYYCMHLALLILKYYTRGDPAFSNVNKHQPPKELYSILSRLLFIFINLILL